MGMSRVWQDLAHGEKLLLVGRGLITVEVSIPSSTVFLGRNGFVDTEHVIARDASNLRIIVQKQGEFLDSADV